MRSRLVHAALFVTLAAFVSACGRSKSSDRRDSAVPANDSSPGKDAQPDVAVPDGPSPDAPLGAETAARDTTAAEIGRDTALPDGPVGLDTHGQDAVRDGASMDTASVKDDALESGRDDAGTSADGLATFCTGTATRSMVNGFPGAPGVRVSRIATGCCDGFTLELNSATFASAIFVTAITSGGGFVPVDIDLANPPQGWSFGVSNDCDATPSSCKEHFTSGFVGWLRTAWVEDSGAIDLGLCLHVEDVDGSHPQLRTFDVYIPHAVSN